MVHCVGPAKGVGGPHEVGPRRARSSEKDKWFGSGAFEGGGPEPPFPIWFEGAFERGGPEPFFFRFTYFFLYLFIYWNASYIIYRR